MKVTVLAESSLYLICSLVSLYSSNAYRHESGRCCSLSFILTYFLSLYLSRFSFYINILITNMLKWRKESDTYLTTVCRHRWSRQITTKVDKLPELSANTICSSDVYRHESGRCRSLSFILTYFLSFHLYINILSNCNTLISMWKQQLYPHI